MSWRRLRNTQPSRGPPVNSSRSPAVVRPGDGGAAARPCDSATTTLTSFLALPQALAQHWSAASASRPPAIKL